MEKKAKCEVEGYLHNISEICQSRDDQQYFTGLLQEAEKNSRVVIFKTRQHNIFVNAEKDRTPVKLCNISFSPSRQIKGDMDIMVNNSSSLKCVRRLSFAFEEKLQETIQHQKLKDIQEDPREYQRVNITAKVIMLTEDCPGVTRSGCNLRKRTYAIADDTASMSLCVWGEKHFEIGKWYTISNASVRQILSTTCLSTTSQTTITLMPDQKCEVAKVVDDTKTTEGQVMTAEVQSNYLCPKQHLLENVNMTTSITRCQKCSAYCKTQSITKVFKAKITIKGNDGKMSDFMIDDYVLRRLLNIQQDSNVKEEVWAAKILESDTFQVKHRKNRVTEAYLLPNSEVSSEQHSTDLTNVQKTTDVPDQLMLEQLFKSANDTAVDSEENITNTINNASTENQVNTEETTDIMPKAVAQYSNLSKCDIAPKPKNKTYKKNTKGNM
ncbi:uncharacterized protein [Misgurnus anguillicaudatus]|uniref:uncharacterized protein n=1 Tax=Misgurnus anguillicaudatus TaxID=75329 RepID=UPI003CCF6986